MAKQARTASEDVVVITHLQVLAACVRERFRMSPQRDPIEMIDACVEKLGLGLPRNVALMRTRGGRRIYVARNCSRGFLIAPASLLTRRNNRSRLRTQYASCLDAGGCGIVLENSEYPIEMKKDGYVVVSLKAIPVLSRCGQLKIVNEAIEKMTAVV